jgi:uncharacterized Rossmann fold enzyme
MDFQQWEPIYEQILADMGYDRDADEGSVRILKAVTLNSDLHSGEDFADTVQGKVTVVGNAPCLEDDIDSKGIQGAVLCSGSAVGRILAKGIVPDMVFTDLDGDIDPQLKASSEGAVTFIHAHGDNQDLIQRYAGLFKGPVVLTTQSVPEYTVFNYGGYTDGDRAVCYAKHFNAKDIRLVGFDYEHPMGKEGSEPAVKLRKLQWAKKIIENLCLV